MKVLCQSPAPLREFLLFTAVALLCVGSIGLGRAETLNFAKVCAAGDRITIAAVGDLLFNDDLQRYALSGNGSYRSIWRGIEHVIQAADIGYANLEGPVASTITYDGRAVGDPGRDWQSPVYRAPQSYLTFNYHPSLIADIKASGFRVVSTANNHTLDRGATGIAQTIDALEGRGVAFTGTRKRLDDRPWSTVTSVRGFTLAWLACTYGLNRPQLRKQVLLCYEERETVLQEIRKRIADPAVDAVVLLPHWGTEYSGEIEQQQRDLARDAIDAGALLVIGSHPHVVQPWEKWTGADGREALVIYSSGDFVSYDLARSHRAGLISLIELWKQPERVGARISAASYVLTAIDLKPLPHIVEAREINQPSDLPGGNRVRLARAAFPYKCP